MQHLQTNKSTHINLHARLRQRIYNDNQKMFNMLLQPGFPSEHQHHNTNKKKKKTKKKNLNTTPQNSTKLTTHMFAYILHKSYNYRVSQLCTTISSAL